MTESCTDCCRPRFKPILDQRSLVLAHVLHGDMNLTPLLVKKFVYAVLGEKILPLSNNLEVAKHCKHEPPGMPSQHLPHHMPDELSSFRPWAPVPLELLTASAKQHKSSP